MQKRVFLKSVCYIGAFLVVWIPATITPIVAPKYSPYTYSFFLPLQGALNAIIYSDYFFFCSSSSNSNDTSKGCVGPSSIANSIRTSVRSSWSRVSLFRATANINVVDDTEDNAADDNDNNNDNELKGGNSWAPPSSIASSV